MKRIISFLVLMTVLIWSKGQIYHVGDLYTAPDGSQGIVYHVLPDGSGWVVALNDMPITLPWGNYFDVAGIPNFGGDSSASYLNYPLQAMADTAGYSNTMAILNSPQTVLTAANGIHDVSDGWYLPSAGQLSMLYAQQPLIETSLIDAGGSLLDEGDFSSYWSSTEKDAYQAWTVNSSAPTPSSGFLYTHSGELIPENKTSQRRVRAVRNLPLPQNIYDTTLQYVWNTESTEAHIQDVPLQNSSYSVTVTNTYGCTNTASANVIVIDNEPQIYYDTICQGAEYDNYGFTLGAGETAVAGERVFTLTTTVANCEREDTLFLTVIPADTIHWEQTADLSYEWNGITYNESGDYIQYFNNHAGCDSVTILHLIISQIIPSGGGCDTLDIYLPNAISPTRKDGLNDYFCIPAYYIPCIKALEISIFNRWGTLVFHSMDKHFLWHGEYNGRIFFNVVYHYQIRCTDYLGNGYNIRGFITVL